MMRPSYPNGSVFLVPLKDGGTARGVVARTAPGGKMLLGYFFGPRFESRAEAAQPDLKPENAVLCLRFGDLGLLKGLWPVIGTVPNWNPARWPTPDAVRRDLLGNMKPVLIKYDDYDPSKVVSEQILEADNGLPDTGLAGYGFVESKLTKLLG